MGEGSLRAAAQTLAFVQLEARFALGAEVSAEAVLAVCRAALWAGNTHKQPFKLQKGPEHLWTADQFDHRLINLSKPSTFFSEVESKCWRENTGSGLELTRFWQGISEKHVRSLMGHWGSVTNMCVIVHMLVLNGYRSDIYDRKKPEQRLWKSGKTFHIFQTGKVNAELWSAY